MHSSPVIVHQPQFQIIGMSTVTSLRENEEKDPVGRMANTFHSRLGEISLRLDSAILLVQIYPDEGEFNQETRYTVIIGVRVEGLDQVPAGMVGHTVPEGDYVRVTHTGPESDLGATYGFITTWINSQAPRRFGGHDFEVMDERYNRHSPESETNQIDIYVALQ